MGGYVSEEKWREGAVFLFYTRISGARTGCRRHACGMRIVTVSLNFSWSSA